MGMDKVARTGFVVMLGDGKMTAALAEFLLQLQGGLMQGSTAHGALVPRGSVILLATLNQKGKTLRSS